MEVGFELDIWNNNNNKIVRILHHFIMTLKRKINKSIIHLHTAGDAASDCPSPQCKYVK